MSLTYEQFVTLVTLLVALNSIALFIFLLTTRATLKHTEGMVRDTLSIRVGYVVENKHVTFHNPPDGGSKMQIDYGRENNGS